MRKCSYRNNYESCPSMEFLSNICSVEIEEKENYCRVHKYKCKLNSCLERSEEVEYCYKHREDCWTENCSNRVNGYRIYCEYCVSNCLICGTKESQSANFGDFCLSCYWEEAKKLKKIVLNITI